MSTYVIGLFVAIGFGGWVFSQLQRRTGGADPKTTWTLTAVAAGIAYLFIIILFSVLFND